MFHSLNQAFKIIGLLGRFQNKNPAWCWEQREGRLIWPNYVFQNHQSPSFTIIAPSFSPFSVVSSNQRFSNFRSTEEVGFVKLSSECYCGNRVFKINTEFCCHLCWGTSIIFRHKPSSMYGDPLHLVLVFGHCSSQLMKSSHDLCMPSWPWILLLWMHLTEWPFRLQSLQLNVHQQSILSENVTSLPLCNTFIQTVSKHNL